MGIGILIIAAGIGLLFNHDYWYLFPIPMTIGGFILYFDFSMKKAVIEFVDEQMKPIHELSNKIISDIENHYPKNTCTHCRVCLKHVQDHTIEETNTCYKERMSWDLC